MLVLKTQKTTLANLIIKNNIMNEKALLYAFQLYANNGYEGSFEDYKKLITTDDNVLNESFKLFKDDGYGNTIEDFSKLVREGKSKDPVKETVDMGSNNQAVNGDFNLEDGSLAYSEEDKYKDRKKRIKEIEAGRAKQERLATTYAYENYEGDEAAAYVQKALQDYDEQFKKELDLIRVRETPNGTFEDQEKAIEQLRKDTGATSMRGKSDDLLGYAKQGARLVNYNAGAEETATEIIELDQELEASIIAGLSKRDLKKLKDGFFTLEEKEELINKHKATAVEKELAKLDQDFKNQQEQARIKSTELNARSIEIDAQLNRIKRSKPNGDYTQEEIDEYNSLLDEYKIIQGEADEFQKQYEIQIQQLADKQSTIEGAYGVDLAAGVFKNNFELSDEIEAFREKYAGEGWWNGFMDTVVGEGLQGTFKTIMLIETGLPSLLVKGADFLGEMTGFLDDEEYSYYDAFFDTLTNFTDYDLMPKSESEKFRIVKEEGGLAKFNARSYSKLGVSMLPFTIGLINEVKRGQTGTIGTKVGNFFTKLGGKSKVLSPLSLELKNNIIMAEAAFKATFVNNYKDAEKRGLSDSEAMGYAVSVSLAEGLVQSIMPDANFLKGITGKAIKDNFVGTLKGVATREGIKTAGKSFFTNIAKELGEEELTEFGKLFTDVSYGLALPKGSEFLNNQIELVAGTIMLSGGMGTVGSYQTFRNQKQLIYNQIRDNIASTDLYLKTLQEGLDPESLEYKQIEEARRFALDVYKATQTSPQNVTAEQIDLIMQKGKLVEQKKNVDSAFHSEINDQIAAIDEQIRQSDVKGAVARAFDQDIKNLEKSIKSSGVEVDDTIIFETDENGTAQQKQKEFLINQAGYTKAQAEEASNSYGLFVEANGKQIFVVNKDSALQDSTVTTGQHEFLHKVLKAALGKDPELAKRAAIALMREVESMVGSTENLLSSTWYRRWNQYYKKALAGEISAESFYEEALPLFSEALTNKSIQYNPDVLKRVGDLIRQILQNLGIRNIRFETGKDVVNFIVDYNKAYQKGSFKGSLKAFATEGKARGVKDPIKTKAQAKSAAEELRDRLNIPKVKQSIKEDLQNKLNNLEDQVMNGEIDYDTYEAQLRSLEEKIEQLEIKAEAEAAKPKSKKKKDSGEESLSNISARSKKILDRIGNDPNGFNPNDPKIYEVLDGLIRSKSKAFKTTGGNIVNLNKLPDFEMENMVQETLAQLIPMIKKFDPKRNDSLYGYINSQLANKMKQALKSGKVTTQQFTSDVTEQKGLMAEETTTAKEDKPKYTKLIDADIVGADVINTISDKLLSSVRVLRNRLTAAIGRNQNTSPLIAEILSNISSQADIDLKKAMGGKQDGILRKWLLRNKKAIIENLTTTFLMGKDQKGKNTVLGGLPIAIQKRVNGEWLSYPNWVGKEIDRETTEKRGATAGNQMVRRVPANKISDADFLSFFLDSTGNPLRGRKEALAKELAGEIGLELFVEAIQSETGPIFEAFERNQDILGEVLKDNYIGEINKQAERGTVKFSLKQTSEKLSDLIQKTDEGPVLDYLNAASLNLNKLNEDASPEQIINALLPEFKKELFNKALSKIEIRALRLETLKSLIKNDVVDYVEIAGAIPVEVERFIYQQKEIAAEVAFKQLEKNLSKANEENKKRILFEFAQVYSRAIRGSKILGITNNQKFYDKLVEIAGEDIVKNTFDIATVLGGKTLVFKGNNQSVSPFTSTPLLKAEAEAMLVGEDFEMEWDRFSNRTRVETAIARSLIVDFIETNIKIYGKQAVKKQLLLLYGDQSSIIRKLSYWSGVEQSLIGKSGVETVVEHALEAKTIFDALIDFVDSGNKRNLNKVFAQATINLISKNSDNKLRDTKAKDKARYTKANINLAEAAEMSYDDIINKTIVLGHSVNNTIKYSLAADPEFLNKEFNLMLERKTGIRANEKISKARAEQLGKGKGRFDLFLPPNAEDFQGLLYKFLGEGKQGDADFAFFKEYLFDPFDVAENAMSSFRQRLAENLKTLKKELGDIDKDISDETIKRIEATGFTPDQAVRIFIWNRQGNEIPNLTAKEKATLLSIVRRDPKLMRYAKELMRITEQFGGYPPASDSWYAGNSTSDLYQYANENVRAKFLETWQANADAIFNKDNLIKLEALYGKDFVKNLKEVLRRMKSGSNRPLNMDDSASAMLDYINGSVGTIMFLNIRSAVLQTISSVNFLNWHDNNLFAAGKTLTNPKNFIKTFMEIMNSDFLKQRRNGLEINVSEAEIATAMQQSKNKAKALFSALIKFGYKPTQFADSFAIAIGGTSFLINRTNTYIKSGLDPKAAREKAFTDFRAIAEENQQSSRTDRTSNIQASTQGRLLFAFNNTPFQMTRIMKKAVLDLVNRRGDTKTNISKIIYYGAIQNILFYSLQQASMAVLFGLGDDEEDEKKQKTAKEKRDRLLNSTLDGILRGSGLPGAIISTAKNVILEYYVQDAKDPFVQDHGKTIIAALNFSPPLGSKASRIYTGLKGKKFEKTTFDAIKNKSKIAAAITNIPVDRMVTKIDNMRVAVNQPIEDWKRLALLAGWDQWSLGVYDDLKAIEEANTPNNTGKSRSQIMKEVWDKKKAEDKKQRMDNISKLKGKAKLNL
jgi:hypothetical protein